METAALDPHVRDLFVGSAHAERIGGLDRFAAAIGRRVGLRRPDRVDGRDRLLGRIEHRWALPAHLERGLDVVDADGLEGWSRAWSTREGYDSLELGDRHAFVIPVEPAEQPMSLSALDARRLQPRTRMSPRATPRPERAQARAPGVRERWRATPSGALSPYPTALGDAGRITPSLLRFPDARAVAGRGEAQLIAVERTPVPVRNPMVPTARLSAGLAAEALSDAATGRAQRFLEAPAPVTLWLTTQATPAAGLTGVAAGRPSPIPALRSLRRTPATTFLARSQQALDAERLLSTDPGVRAGYEDLGFDVERALVEPTGRDEAAFVVSKGAGDPAAARAPGPDGRLPRATSAALEVARAAAARIELETQAEAPARAGDARPVPGKATATAASADTKSQSARLSPWLEEAKVAVPGSPRASSVADRSSGASYAEDRAPTFSNLAALAPETVFVRPTSPWNPAPLEVQTPGPRGARTTALRPGLERPTAALGKAERFESQGASRGADRAELGAAVEAGRAALRPSALTAAPRSDSATSERASGSLGSSQRRAARSRRDSETGLSARVLFTPATAPTPTRVESWLPTNPSLRQSGPQAQVPTPPGAAQAPATRLESFLAALGGPQLLEALDLGAPAISSLRGESIGPRHDLTRDSALAETLETERVVVAPTSATEPVVESGAKTDTPAARGRSPLPGRSSPPASPQRVSQVRALAPTQGRATPQRPDAARALLRAAPLAAAALRHPDRNQVVSPRTGVLRAMTGAPGPTLAAAPAGRPARALTPTPVSAPQPSRPTPSLAPRVESPPLALQTALRSERAARLKGQTPRADRRGQTSSVAPEERGEALPLVGTQRPSTFAPVAEPSLVALDPWSPAATVERWLAGADRLVAWVRHLDFGTTDSASTFRLTALPGLTLLSPSSAASAGGALSTTASDPTVARALRNDALAGEARPALARRLGLDEPRGDAAAGRSRVDSLLATASPERTVLAGTAGSPTTGTAGSPTTVALREAATTGALTRSAARPGASTARGLESSRPPLAAERLVALAGRIAARTGVSLGAALALVDRYEAVARPHALASGFEALTSLVAPGARGGSTAERFGDSGSTSLSPGGRGVARRGARSERSVARLRAPAPAEARAGGRLGGVVLPELVRRLGTAEPYGAAGIGDATARSRPIGELNVRRALVAFERAEAQGGPVDRTLNGPSTSQSPASRATSTLPEVVRPSGGTTSAPTDAVAAQPRGGRASALADAAPSALLVTAPTLSGRLFGDRGPAVTVRTGASSPSAGGHGRVMVETAVARRAAEAALRSTPGERPAQRSETGEEARHRLGGDQIDENLSPEEVEKIAFEVIMQLKQALELDATRIGEDEWD